MPSDPSPDSCRRSLYSPGCQHALRAWIRWVGSAANRLEHNRMMPHRTSPEAGAQRHSGCPIVGTPKGCHHGSPESRTQVRPCAFGGSIRGRRRRLGRIEGVALGDRDPFEVARAVDDFFDRAAKDDAAWWYPPEIRESLVELESVKPYRAVPFVDAYRASGVYPEGRLLGCVNRLTDIRLQLQYISYDAGLSNREYYDPTNRP